MGPKLHPMVVSSSFLLQDFVAKTVCKTLEDLLCLQPRCREQIREAD
jgi:hypothetical protein